MEDRLITIAGNIGAGKSSLARVLAQDLEAHLALERFSDNPFLAKAHEDPMRWSMHSQLWFLLSFTQTGQDLHNYPGLVIQDRSLIEAFEVFARLYNDHGLMSDDEFHLLEVIYNQSLNKIRHPDLMLFLDTPPELCYQRICLRNRQAESTIEIDFLEKVKTRLDLFVESWPGQVVRIDGTPDLRQREHLETVLAQLP